jgi:hypothetical protein
MATRLMREILFKWGCVWLSEVPERYTFEAGDVLAELVELDHSNRTQDQAFTVGCKYKRLAQTACFGVLGATFTPNQSGQLRVQVAVADNAPHYVGGWSGLTRKSAQVVFEEVLSQRQKLDVLGAGVLRFDKAAEHPVDSAPIVYRYLVNMILALMDPTLDDMSAEGLAALMVTSIDQVNNALADGD